MVLLFWPAVARFLQSAVTFILWTGCTFQVGYSQFSKTCNRERSTGSHNNIMGI